MTQVTLRSLATPSQYPVIALVDSAGVVIEPTGVGGVTSVDGLSGAVSLTSNYERPLSPLGRANCSSSLTLTGSAQDVPGMTVTFTPSVAGVALVTCTFDFSGAVDGEILQGVLVVDGATRSETALFSGAARITVSNTWMISLTAGVSHTLKAQALRVSGSNAGHGVNATHSGLAYMFIPGTA